MQFLGFDVIASGLTAQRLRMDVISGNMANVETTRTPEGGPYKRKVVLFQESLNNAIAGPFGPGGSGTQPSGVKVSGIVEGTEPTRTIYAPQHPDADENGYVEMPNVNIVHEMTDMISATRAYEANLMTMNLAKSMYMKTLDILRV